MQDWAKEFSGAVTVCDRDFTVIYMNDKSAATFERQGGRQLLGSKLEACHQPRSVEIMRRILETGQPNSYTIEKQGVKKFIYQAPWREDGRIAGLVEISVEIPFELPHFIRT